MEEISKLVLSPGFWFASVFVPLLVGLFTNWLSNKVSIGWLRYLLLVNAVAIVPLPMLGYTITQYPWLNNLALGLAVGASYALPAILPTPFLRIFALLALNVPAAWIGWRIIASDDPDKLELFLSVYLHIAVLWAIVIQVWLLVVVTFFRERFLKVS